MYALLSVQVDRVADAQCASPIALPTQWLGSLAGLHMRHQQTRSPESHVIFIYILQLLG